MRATIGIDWGTSSLRAMLFDEAGSVREQRERAWGIRTLPAGGFEQAYADVCAGWPVCPVIASGMVGSRDGWHEVPYVDVPAGVAALAAQMTNFAVYGERLLSIVPGVRDAGRPDVMRGEETEIVGALAMRPGLASCSQIVLPGTHSKWVDVRGGRITGFRTLMTGELYALLRDHSILGATIPANPSAQTDEAAFDAGVGAARASGNASVLTRLFSARSLVLAALLQPENVPSYLSGLLIGEEWRAMLASGWLHADQSPTLVGAAQQWALYQRAADAFGLPEPAALSNAAARGLWQIHVAATQERAATMTTQPHGHT